jgi:hypothetical protein
MLLIHIGAIQVDLNLKQIFLKLKLLFSKSEGHSSGTAIDGKETYTNEELIELKQLFIVRQSQMERTMEFFEVIQKKPESLYEILRVNEILTDYIFTGVIDKNLNEKFSSYINNELKQFKNGTNKTNVG